MNKLKIYSDASLFDIDKDSNFKYPSVARIKNPKKVEYALDYDIRGVYKRKYFTIEAAEKGVQVYIDIKGYGTAHQGYFCSYDNGKTWETVFEAGETYTDWTSRTLNTGDTLLLKGYDVKYGEFCDSDQSSADGQGYPMNITTINNKQFIVYGNIQSLHYNDNFIEEIGDEHNYSNGAYEYKGLFYNAEGLISAKKLVLQYPIISSYGYSYMFQDCTSLIEAPELPAVSIGLFGGYLGMFWNCTSLTEAPELPATTLNISCYQRMFQDCISLTKAPELPATTLAPNGLSATRCYSNMFAGCTSLTEPPELPATTLADSCYYNMFKDCSSLIEAPELPATTLPTGCYQNMFEGCISLTTAPKLPAVNLASTNYSSNHCCREMFKNCSSLNYIKALFTNIPSHIGNAGPLYEWVKGVAPSGTFVKNPLAIWNTIATSDNNYIGIPSGWTVQTASS